MLPAAATGLPVYFPSKRTSSYQISRPHPAVLCPTTGPRAHVPPTQPPNSPGPLSQITAHSLTHHTHTQTHTHTHTHTHTDTHTHTHTHTDRHTHTHTHTDTDTDTDTHTHTHRQT